MQCVKEINTMKKILLIALLFAGFQAHAAVITVGNLSYDGTLITGDGHTYLGFDTLKDQTYAQTVALTSDGGTYEDYRIANNADADVFIGSLFGGQTSQCSTKDDVATNEFCGVVNDWNADGLFGGSNDNDNFDGVMFLADQGADEVGFLFILRDGRIRQNEELRTRPNGGGTARNTSFDYGGGGYLLVRDKAVTTASVPSPSSLAIFVLGFAGIGFARRRRF
jgi:hypothetical protein